MGRCFYRAAEIVLCFYLGLFWRDGAMSFNLDTTRPLFFSHSDNQSQFGFAFTLHQVGENFKLIAGAPRAQSQAFSPGQVDRSGAVFNCPIDVASTESPECEEVVLDRVDEIREVERLHVLSTSQALLRLRAIFCDATSRLKKSHNNKLVYGAPGSHIWEGAAWRTDGTIDDSSRNSFIPRAHRARYGREFYLGYSVALGNFKGDSELEYAISQPRYNHGYGRVLLYDENGNYYLQLSSSTLGTYFGHAMAVSDLNNDGSEDLIISAPLYTDADRNIAAGWEVGKVSIYYNDKQGGFSENYGIAIGTQEGCRFGYSLAALGDINQDGFNDLAVGAPFCGDGQDGKVFIYHGSGVNIPIDLTPKQILTPSETQRPLKYFGFALSAGMDVDRNTYPGIEFHS
ncbi:integrin alpha-8-like [Diadema antillarum]|uniref:integrin alpha-8-like n=1 Tax=Diadema antillarum TaxID=105358 RepID=UPI003A841D65